MQSTIGFLQTQDQMLSAGTVAPRPRKSMKPVVRSLLETDLYKFTMWQALLHKHPDAQTEYVFVCRNTPAYPLAELCADVEREIDYLCSLRFTEEELDYLRSLRFIKSDFTDFLTLFHFQRKFIHVSTDGDQLDITTKGPQVHVMGFEILYYTSSTNCIFGACRQRQR